MYSIIPRPVDVANALAGRCAVLRKDLGWTQAELARRSGVSLGSLKRFEQSGRISLGHLLRLAAVLQRLGDFDPVFAVDEDLIAARRRFAQLKD